MIDDGPHGSTGDGKGDFDFCKVSGLTGITVDVDTPASELDPVVSIYDATGKQLATNDNEGINSPDSRLTAALPTTGEHYVLVSGFGPDGKTFPFAAFLPKWGLSASDESALIDRIVAVVRENVEKDLAADGTNRRFGIRILNSRDHADPFGQPNLTRLVVGGTRDQSQLPTIGIAHELGHLAGSWHQDQFNAVPSLMDQGGNPKQVFGVGPDGVGGTADDVDVDFAEDVFNPNEHFSGHEDARNRTAWAFIRGWPGATKCGGCGRVIRGWASSAGHETRRRARSASWSR
ncbi:hypothetical protein [Kibdelosporangium phytohabitans]|uniref:Uncharacterized protein n=1 Tax=Kibdelosporangium phytohabitans TaxID=860235 RepID=A0A0N9I016_9PSEU|nr:hypothetical protein [Kibdelosporangium phytohabitans]ALG11372.1 hypothetical protein AOZ06_34910 [Kibdelosporangium phytohabitans]MBE1462696.1 hypothetical protein [Kibdelosporangium phytohabitans]